MSSQAKAFVKDWGPWITLFLWIAGHSLAVESRISKLEQGVADLKEVVRMDLEQHRSVTSHTDQGN